MISPEEINYMVHDSNFTGYYIDELSYAIIEGKVKNNRKELLSYLDKLR